MSISHRFRLTVTGGALVLGLLLAPATQAGDSLTLKQAGAAWKKALNSHTKFHAQEMNEIVKSFCQSLKELDDGLKQGQVNPFDAMTLYFVLVQSAQVQIMQTSDQVKAAMDADGTDIQSQVAPGAPLIFLLAGACTTLDSGAGKVDTQEAKAINRIVKKLKGFNKKLGKKEDQPATVKVDPPAASAPAAPNPPDAGGVPPNPPKELKIDSSAGSSSSLATSDGKLCVGGSADPAGGNVTVQITGPSGVKSLEAPVVNCRWSVCFGGDQGEVGTLQEGNYKIAATQGTASARSAIGVP